MNAQEALKYMLESDDTVECKSMVGNFWSGEKRVYFTCPGDYPCCHYDMTHEEFLRDYKDDVFQKS